MMPVLKTTPFFKVDPHPERTLFTFPHKLKDPELLVPFKENGNRVKNKHDVV